jgi:hypothetical protein
MNLQFAIAGALALVAAVVHGAGGEVLVVTKLHTEVLSPSPFGGPKMTKLMIRVTWHITTLAFAVIGSAMAVCSPAGSSQACEGVGRVGAISFASFALLTFALAAAQGPRRMLRSVRRHPAPFLFVSVAVLAWWGSAS